ncbi:hypothetical protein SAMN06264364_14416 [Quadrisphaera granulorum]|uniref:Uncharacterized protein n=1 Tax=Quadrisphaera granulorum TaxID=317664 RepID=A0A315ZNJ7_9ACTN|nr:hypothetical protein BXY45_14416 [Quadrisphaera granulorum]SZE99004.1 hypothetical protein SAMN06264364_14416 [Quadrisphaera granulorum]
MSGSRRRWTCRDLLGREALLEIVKLASERLHPPANHVGIAVITKRVLGRESRIELSAGGGDPSLPQVPVAEIEVEAGGQSRRIGDPDRGQILSTDSSVGIERTLVPCHLVLESLFEVGEVVRQHAALGMVRIAGPLPASEQVGPSTSAIASERAADG